MSAGCRPTRSAAPGTAPTHKVSRAAHARFSGARTSSCRRWRRCRWARGSRSRGRTSASPSPPTGWHVPQAHLAPIKAKQRGFRRRRRAVSRHALSVGRQDLARHRLLGAGAGRAAGRRHRLPARQRHAGNGARQDRRRSPTCAAATWCSGRATSPSRATARNCMHANAHHMMVAIEPAGGGHRRIKAAGSEVTSVKRLYVQHTTLPQARMAPTSCCSGLSPGWPRMATPPIT